MKIDIAQLKSSLDSKLAPIYVISSDELLLKEEATIEIKATAAKHDFTNIEKFNDQVAIPWDQFVNSSKTQSLFGDKTILELTLNKKPSKESTKILVDYAQKPRKNKLLLISLPKLDSSLNRSKWLKLMEQNGVLIQIWPPDIQNLPQWTLQRLRQNGFKTTLEVATLIAAKNANNLFAINQEIEKLSLLFPDQKNRELNLDNISNLLSNNCKYSVFNLVDYALAGDRKQVIKVLQNLKDDGIEPILLLWALARDIRTLLKIITEQRSNPNLAAILEKERVFYKRKPLITKAVRRLSVTKLHNLLQKAAKIDYSIKGVEPENVWLQILSLSLRLAT